MLVVAAEPSELRVREVRPCRDKGRCCEVVRAPRELVAAVVVLQAASLGHHAWTQVALDSDEGLARRGGAEVAQPEGPCMPRSASFRRMAVHHGDRARHAQGDEEEQDSGQRQRQHAMEAIVWSLPAATRNQGQGRGTLGLSQKGYG